MRFEAGENEAGRRLDRVLKKILSEAPLSLVYRVARKDVKVNGRRMPAETLLAAGDIVDIFLPDERIAELGRKRSADPSAPKAKRQFGIVFEDENVLAVSKPFGLLTHGDDAEKKNTLANQVVDYLAESGGYTPGAAKAFVPAPANRLDRNTTGLVLFGKTLPATQALAVMLKGSEDGNAHTEKVYLTVVAGLLTEPLVLRARMVRDREENVTRVLPAAGGLFGGAEDGSEGLTMVTEVRPLALGKGYTLTEARLLTGRTHQIRAQLADAGFPVIGDRKYGNFETNRTVSKKYDLTTQLLHAYRITVRKGTGSLEYLQNRIFLAQPPERFLEIAEDLGCRIKKK